MEAAPKFLTWILAASSISVLILVATVVAVLWWNQRRLALQATAWGVHLLGAQEAERQRIARDLHDDIVQRLSVARMRIEGADPVSASALVGEVAHDLRSLAHELYPSSLQHLSLAQALCDLAEQQLSNSGLAVTLDCDEQITLGERAMAALYRTAQEGMQNVHKHSNARAVTISLARDGAWAALSVRDDGVGLNDAVERGSSFGLRSIAERLALVGGTMSIDTAGAGGGTVLVARVPA